jgi:predicted GIY-YIG superfamily endonuclease
MEDKNYKLYSLNDETGVRYIGITKQKLSARFSAHISSCKQAFKNKKSRNHRHCWIKSLLDKGLLPKIELINEFKTAEEIKIAEINAIKSYSNLVNSTAGGDGIREYKFTQEYLENVRFKVDQYDLHGNLLNTFNSLSEASFIVTGTQKNNNKISGVINGKKGRRTAFGYVWRLKGEPFNKYPVTGQWNVTEARRNSLSKRQLENNVMKGKTGILNQGSKPVIICDINNIILHITETVKEVRSFTKLSKTCVNKMLKTNKEIAGYKLVYANKDIVQSLQKCKSSTLNTFVGQQYIKNNLEVDY